MTTYQFPHRGPNNELLALPGFFYRPENTEGLAELSAAERVNIVSSGQGLYSASLVDPNHSGEVADLECYLDNENIPTHRKIENTMPAFGTVPVDLFEVSHLAENP